MSDNAPDFPAGNLEDTRDSLARAKAIVANLESLEESYKEDQANELKTVRPEIQEFAKRMEKAMAEHDVDRGDSWQKENLGYLMKRLLEETAELVQCTTDYKDETQDDSDHFNLKFIVDEAVDVGNLAMMIAWKAKKLSKDIQLS